MRYLLHDWFLFDSNKAQVRAQPIALQYRYLMGLRISFVRLSAVRKREPKQPALWGQNKFRDQRVLVYISSSSFFRFKVPHKLATST
jgi:hypothetical protein